MSALPQPSDATELVEENIADFIRDQVCCPRIWGCELNGAEECPAERVRVALTQAQARATAAEGEIARRDAVARGAWGDQADEYTAEIEAAHPVNTKDHDTFALALKMVGKRHGKYELVGLVHWLLRSRDAAQEDARVSKGALFLVKNDLRRAQRALELIRDQPDTHASIGGRWIDWAKGRCRQALQPGA